MDLGGVGNKAPQDPGVAYQGIYLFFSDLGDLLRLLGSGLLFGLGGRLDLFLPAGAQRVEGDLEPLLIHPTDLGGLCSVVVAGAEAGKIHLGAVGLELRKPCNQHALEGVALRGEFEPKPFYLIDLRYGHELAFLFV